MAQNLPGAPKFDLTAGVWRTGDGQLSYVGGFQGAISNIAGSLLKGNAISPTSVGLDILFDFTGKMVDHFTHKIGKERALAAQVTMTSYYVYQNARFQQLNHADKLFIEIGADQQKIAQMQELADELQEARKIILAREPGGFSLTSDRIALEQKLNDIKIQISDLQGNAEALTVELNALRGQSKAGLHQPFSAQLPWDGVFPTVTEEQEKQWLTQLTGDDSPDPRMQEALTARKVMERTMALQRLKKLPAINFAGVFTPPDSTNTNGLKNSIFEPLGGEVWRVSEMAPGANPTLQVDIPLFDKQRSTMDKILGLEQQKTESKIEKTRIDLAEELARSVGNIRNLSGQIGQVQEAYNSALQAWQLKAGRPDLYLPQQLVSERIQLDQWMGKIIELKARYLEEESNLKRMKLLQQDGSLVKDHAMTGDQAQISRRTFLTTSLAGLFALGFAKPLAAQYQPQVPVNTLDNTPAGMWSIMHGGGAPGSSANLSALENILMGDPNIQTRRDALKILLQEYKNDNGFFKTLQSLIMRSPYQDVFQELLSVWP